MDRVDFVGFGQPRWSTLLHGAVRCLAAYTFGFLHVSLMPVPPVKTRGLNAGSSGCYIVHYELAPGLLTSFLLHLSEADGFLFRE